ncbi:MAG: 3-hydroxyacyl-CoA dehydrogenase NAD-binding domain-containing protein, partial [Candidatus Thermoplasmatota archaeon]
MDIEDIKKIGVVGAGTMGQGIAQTAAQSGFEVWIRDIEDELLEGAVDSIKGSLERNVEKERISEKEKNNILGSIHTTLDLEDLEECDVIIEAVIEDVDIKKDVFRKLDEICTPKTILASNTSTIPITELASATERPERF